MENNTCKIDPHDEVRKLQDQVRKLELQNEQLRSQQYSRNGLLENRQNIISRVPDADYFMKRIDLSCHSLDDQFLRPEEIDNEELSNEETWLQKAEKSIDDNSPRDLLQWLRQDVDNQKAFEMQRIRRMMIQRIDEIEQGLRRNNIDTRTFTRSKKRMCRPSLETMSESPILETKGLSFSPWQKLLSTQITETIDDFSLRLDNTFPSLSKDSPNLNSFRKSDLMGFNSFQKMASEPRLNMTSEIKLDTPFLKIDFENQEPNTLSQKSSDSDLSTNSRKASDPCLNTTYQKPQEMTIVQMPVRSRSITPSGLNCTFSIGRATSFDSGADDDQLSSASDSSMSSSTRLMNVGDVQNIARLQEESLKQVMSTPKHSSLSKEGNGLGLGVDLPSPIRRSTHDLNHGYLSDHSDHSSAEGRARSSRSSVRSSPASSPFGSTQVLINECAPSNPAAGLPHRDLKLIPPARTQEFRKTESVTRAAELGRGRPMSSGLRRPAVRTQGGTTGIARPATAGSGIPRPQSRIPAPRVRSTACSTQPTNKVDWMDGCY